MSREIFNGACCVFQVLDGVQGLDGSGAAQDLVEEETTKQSSSLHFKNLQKDSREYLIVRGLSRN